MAGVDRSADATPDVLVSLRFAPLLGLLDAHRQVLREAIAAAAAGMPLPNPAAALPIPGAAGMPSPAQSALAALDQSVRSALDAARSAAARGDVGKMWTAVGEALEQSDRLTVGLIDQSLAEIMAVFSERERTLTERLQSEFLDAMRVGRFSLRIADGLIVQADEAFASFLGTDPGHLVGVPAGRFIAQEKLVEIVEASLKSGRPGRARVRTLGLDRAPATLDIIAFMQQAADQDELQFMAVNVSASDDEVIQRRLLSAAIEASDDLVLITDPAFNIVYVNPAFWRITGYEADEVLGRHPRFLQGRDTPGAALDRMRVALKGGEPVRAELINYRKDGQPFWIDLSVVPVAGAGAAIEHWVSVGRDVSERKQAEQEITRLAMEDYLTGLPNRRAAEARLQLEWNRARRNRGKFAIGLVDIDRFKLVNDKHGHELGDRALRHIAQVVQSNLRGGDWVARWGGEEFLICFHDLDAPGALVAGERTRKQVKARPLDTGVGELPLTVSLGISVYRPALETVAQMLAEADGLLYEAKQGGRDKVLCAGAAEGRRNSVIWEGTRVQSALQDSRVVPAYQPIVDLRTGVQVGDEAFARIIAPDNSVIPAARFIEAAESLQLSASIDEAITSHALQHGAAASSRLAASKSTLRLTHFINLSPQFLASRESVDALIVQAKSSGLAESRNGRYVLEITERQSGDLESLKKHLQPLVEAGFNLALDDFGSGYSSFQYLADLPIGYLKVEGWMVARAVGDSRIRQLLETIVATAQKFKLITIAECVEEASTAQVLCDLGVDWAQGYFFGAPALDGDASGMRVAGVGRAPAAREGRRR